MNELDDLVMQVRANGPVRLPLEGWDHASVWGWDEKANSLFANLWRNNDDPKIPWSDPLPFGQSLGQVQAVTMIESNFGTPGNLEVIALAGNQLYTLYRDSSSLEWSTPIKMQAVS